VTVGPRFDRHRRPDEPTIRLGRYAGLPGAQMLHVVPPARYPSVPPALHGFEPADAGRARWFLGLLAREAEPCPAEAVMLYRDAWLLDGKQVLAQDLTGVGESFVNLLVTDAVVARHHEMLGRIGRGEVDRVAADGPPFVALFNEACMNYGHVLVETLPRLLHLEAAGIRRMRLALPDEAAPLRAMVAFTLDALGLEAEFVPCAPGSVLQVPQLHWVSPVARHEFRKSPTLLRLAERLRPAGGGDARLYVSRGGAARRPVTNGAEVEAIAARLGYRVVDPSLLPFAEQIALFAGARAVAGPMGAALASMVFMPPGGRVAMFEAGNCDPFFWDLACLCGHAFHWAFTAPATDYDMAMLTRPMSIDPGLARLVLERLAG
jgi:hypothetical protein